MKKRTKTYEGFETFLKTVGALTENTQVVLPSGRYRTVALNMDALYAYTRYTSTLCMDLARRFPSTAPIEAVAAPAEAGIVAQWVAHHLSDMFQRQVMAVHADRNEFTLLHNDTEAPFEIGILCCEQVVKEKMNAHESPIGAVAHRMLPPNDCFIGRGTGYSFKESVHASLAGKNVLIVDGALTNSPAVLSVVHAVRELHGNVIGVGALCNLGGITAQQVGAPPRIESLLEIPCLEWSAADSHLRKQKKPEDAVQATLAGQSSA